MKWARNCLEDDHGLDARSPMPASNLAATERKTTIARSGANLAQWWAPVFTEGVAEDGSKVAALIENAKTFQL
jgi:hypothetical protein